MDIEFIDELPTAARRDPSKFEKFAAELRKRPGVWAVYPFRGRTRAPQQAHILRKGKVYKDFPPNEFQVANFNDTVYIRFMGAAQ